MPPTSPQRAALQPTWLPPWGKVKGAGALTTAAYRSALRGFLDSGQAVTVEGFAAYIHQLRRTRSAATVNQALAAGRKLLQAAEALGLPAKEISLIRGALGEIPGCEEIPAGRFGGLAGGAVGALRCVAVANAAGGRDAVRQPGLA